MQLADDERKIFHDHFSARHRDLANLVTMPKRFSSEAEWYEFEVDRLQKMMEAFDEQRVERDEEAYSHHYLALCRLYRRDPQRFMSVVRAVSEDVRAVDPGAPSVPRAELVFDLFFYIRIFQK